jgi:hypothetical protein
MKATNPGSTRKAPKDYVLRGSRYCPACGAGGSSVSETRHIEKAILRLKSCNACHHRFWTCEVLAQGGRGHPASREFELLDLGYQVMLAAMRILETTANRIASTPKHSRVPRDIEFQVELMIAGRDLLRAAIKAVGPSKSKSR